MQPSPHPEFYTATANGVPAGLVDERRVFLSALPALPGDRRRALIAAGACAIAFLALLPFAKVRVGEVWVFIPIYQTAFVVFDLITGALLFAQCASLRSRALMVLASGYVFTAFMAAAHALTFPGLFAPHGLLGAGPHSTAWMYMFWHAGFPLSFIAYALLKDARLRLAPAAGVAAGIATALAAGAALTALATAGGDFLPGIMSGNHYAPAYFGTVVTVWLLPLIAAALLWRRKPHSALDLWLMVVMAAWFFDVALAAVFNAGRFDLGFYAGRIYGLLAASFVLVMLLVENTLLYGRLAAAHESEFRERRRAQDAAIQLEAASKELESFSYSVSHDLRAPLRAVDGYALMLEEDCAGKLDEEGRRLLAVIRDESARMGRLIDDLLEFSRTGRKALETAPVDMAALAREAVAELGREYPAASVELKALPPAVGDRALLKQVWTNLVANALKYSSKRGAPRVEIGGAKNGAEADYWVRDNGAGFDPRYAGKLFGVFQRLHSSDEFPGTGVGLAIVQRVVARHGGRVWAEGRPNEGARFCFALPLQEDRA